MTDLLTKEERQTVAMGAPIKYESGLLYEGDCLEIMPTLPAGSVDMILCDLPYGTTACKWDSIIPFEPLWREYRRLIKPKGAIVLTASQPFSTALGYSAIDILRYSWTWNKHFAGNFVQAKRMPLKVCEDVLVFCKSGSPAYYPQMVKRDKAIKSGGNGQKEGKAIRMKPKNYALNKTYELKFPETLISFSVREGRGLHPTQKPVALFEYLIKTYTRPGEVVLDNCAGSGTTGIAATNTDRRFILIEKEKEYIAVMKKRFAK